MTKLQGSLCRTPVTHGEALSPHSRASASQRRLAIQTGMMEAASAGFVWGQENGRFFSTSSRQPAITESFEIQFIVSDQVVKNEMLGMITRTGCAVVLNGELLVSAKRAAEVPFEIFGVGLRVPAEVYAQFLGIQASLMVEQYRRNGDFRLSPNEHAENEHLLARQLLAFWNQHWPSKIFTTKLRVALGSSESAGPAGSSEIGEG